MKTPVVEGPDASAGSGPPSVRRGAIAPRHGPPSRPQAPLRASYQYRPGCTGTRAWRCKRESDVGSRATRFTMMTLAAGVGLGA